MMKPSSTVPSSSSFSSSLPSTSSTSASGSSYVASDALATRLRTYTSHRLYDERGLQHYHQRLLRLYIQTWKEHRKVKKQRWKQKVRFNYLTIYTQKRSYYLRWQHFLQTKQDIKRNNAARNSVAEIWRCKRLWSITIQHWKIIANVQQTEKHLQHQAMLYYLRKQFTRFLQCFSQFSQFHHYHQTLLSRAILYDNQRILRSTYREWCLAISTSHVQRYKSTIARQHATRLLQTYYFKRWKLFVAWCINKQQSLYVIQVQHQKRHDTNSPALAVPSSPIRPRILPTAARHMQHHLPQRPSSPASNSSRILPRSPVARPLSSISSTAAVVPSPVAPHPHRRLKIFKTHRTPYVSSVATSSKDALFNST